VEAPPLIGITGRHGCAEHVTVRESLASTRLRTQLWRASVLHRMTATAVASGPALEGADCAGLENDDTFVASANSVPLTQS
jgi:hypothetical protein